MDDMLHYDCKICWWITIKQKTCPFKNLNFASPPQHISKLDNILAIEEITHHLRVERQEEFKIRTQFFLEKPHQIKQNVFKAEQQSYVLSQISRNVRFSQN